MSRVGKTSGRRDEDGSDDAVEDLVTNIMKRHLEVLRPTHIVRNVHCSSIVYCEVQTTGQAKS